VSGQPGPIRIEETASSPTADLVAKVPAGDRDAEGELCRRFLPAVRAFARRRLRGAAVEEFVQDALVIFVEALRQGAVQDGARAGGYLLGICRNLARDRARARDRRDELWATYGATVSEHAAEPQERLAWEAIHLEDCVSKLARRAREVVIFTFADGMSDAEISGKVDAAEGNVRVVRHRALKALRECMAGRITWEDA
jgi:RNA polymerase sigma-70 factor (ECF subfamily)